MPQYEALIVSLLVRGDRPIGMRVHEHMGLLEVVRGGAGPGSLRGGDPGMRPAACRRRHPLQGSARTFSK